MFKEGEYIIYHNGDKYELGKIKEITKNGAFVYYSSSEIPTLTSFEDMYKLVNGFVIGGTILGGARL